MPPSDVTLRKAMDEQEHYMEQRQVGTSFYAHRTPHTAHRTAARHAKLHTAAHTAQGARCNTHGTALTLQRTRLHGWRVLVHWMCAVCPLTVV